jgi:hypothetical protein
VPRFFKSSEHWPGEILEFRSVSLRLLTLGLPLFDTIRAMSFRFVLNRMSFQIALLDCRQPPLVNRR